MCEHNRKRPICRSRFEMFCFVNRKDGKQHSCDVSSILVWLSNRNVWRWEFDSNENLRKRLVPMIVSIPGPADYIIQSLVNLERGWCPGDVSWLLMPWLSISLALPILIVIWHEERLVKATQNAGDVRMPCQCHISLTHWVRIVKRSEAHVQANMGTLSSGNGGGCPCGQYWDYYFGTLSSNQVTVTHLDIRYPQTGLTRFSNGLQWLD